MAKAIKPKYRILVPRVVDSANNNAQALNARAMLARFENTECEWTAANFREPDPMVAKSSLVRLIKLWRWRFWQWRMFLLYQQRADAIFCPGFYWFDIWALRLRHAMRRRVPIIATLEGLGGNESREKIFSDLAGHPVFCGQVSDKLLGQIDWVMRQADHVIAISPFLAKMGTAIYGEKFSVLPLGINSEVFHARGRKESGRFQVIGTGTAYERKRPWVFLELAERFPDADFTWFGEGELRTKLLEDIARLGLRNVNFPGAISNLELADKFRRANLFVLPAHSEGVPKVSQEAAACGVPVILYGFYEAPSVVDGENGYVVWSDEECIDRVGELISAPLKSEEMGRKGAQMALSWGWNEVVPRWETKIIELQKRC